MVYWVFGSIGILLKSIPRVFTVPDEVSVTFAFCVLFVEIGVVT